MGINIGLTRCGLADDRVTFEIAHLPRFIPANHPVITCITTRIVNRNGFSADVLKFDEMVVQIDDHLFSRPQ